MSYFDEVGYTGADLINGQQPYFTLASVLLESDEIAKIKCDIGYDDWDKELHFKSMYSNPQGRKMLERIFSHPLLNEKRVRLAFAHKRYCIYAQIVNILIESFYTEQGVNIYKGASNLVMANCLYYGAVLHQNQDLVKEFESYFVRMECVQDVYSVADFYKTTDKLRSDGGTNFYIGCGATIIGNVTIGDNARIGANAIIVKDVPENSVTIMRGIENRY